MAVLLAGAAGIAFAPIFVRTSEVGPVATAFWRVLLAFPILLAWMEIEGRRSGKPERPSGLHDLLALSASGLFLGSTFALWHLSLGLTSVANSTLLVNLAPGFVALGAWLLLGQRFGTTFLVGLTAALGGAALLVAGGPSELGGGAAADDGLAALAAAFYAGYFLSVSGLRPRFSTAAVMVYGAPAACAARGGVPTQQCNRQFLRPTPNTNTGAPLPGFRHERIPRCAIVDGTLEAAPIGEYRMCQRAVRRL